MPSFNWSQELASLDTCIGKEVRASSALVGLKAVYYAHEVFPCFQFPLFVGDGRLNQLRPPHPREDLDVYVAKGGSVLKA